MNLQPNQNRIGHDNDCSSLPVLDSPFQCSGFEITMYITGIYYIHHVFDGVCLCVCADAHHSTHSSMAAAKNCSNATRLFRLWLCYCCMLYIYIYNRYWAIIAFILFIYARIIIKIIALNWYFFSLFKEGTRNINIMIL